MSEYFTLVEDSLWVHEVTRDVRTIRVFSTPIMVHSAITLPWHSRRVYIIVGDKRDWKTEEGSRTHELVHVRQISEMGAVAYLLAHIIARIKARNVYAWNESIEKEAYDAERVVLAQHSPYQIRIPTSDVTLSPFSNTDVLVGTVEDSNGVTKWYRKLDNTMYGLYYVEAVTNDK